MSAMRDACDCTLCENRTAPVLSPTASASACAAITRRANGDRLTSEEDAHAEAGPGRLERVFDRLLGGAQEDGHDGLGAHAAGAQPAGEPGGPDTGLTLWTWLGSIVVTQAPISRLLGAGRRRREPDTLPPPASPESLSGLGNETLDLLRQLAISSLDALAIVPTDQFIEQEMLRVFATLMKSVPEGSEREEVLQQAIRNALDEA